MTSVEIAEMNYGKEPVVWYSGVKKIFSGGWVSETFRYFVFLQTWLVKNLRQLF